MDWTKINVGVLAPVWILFTSAPKWIYLLVLINLVYGNIWYCIISALVVLFKCGVPIIFKILYSETNFGALEKNQSWIASCVALEKKIHLSFIMLYYETYSGTLVKNKIIYDLPWTTRKNGFWSARLVRIKFNHDKTNIWGAREMYLGHSWNVIGTHPKKFWALVHGALWLWGEVTSTHLLHYYII